jgi:hypothetical protein
MLAPLKEVADADNRVCELLLLTTIYSFLIMKYCGTFDMAASLLKCTKEL